MRLNYIYFLMLVVVSTACADRSAQPAPVRFTPVAVEAGNAHRTIEPVGATAPDTFDAPAEGVAGTGQTGAREADPPLAARVNDQPILLETYEREVAQMVQALPAEAVDEATEAGQAILAQAKRQVLEALIDQLIIEQKAAALGISISDEKLDTYIRESIAQGQSEEQFEAWLAANNLTPEAFRRTLRSQLIANQVFENVTRDLPAVADQIRLRHIQVADEAEARTIIEQLKNGTDFETLANAHSLDESSRLNGGDVGWFGRGLAPLPSEVEERAFSLDIGQVSGPIETVHGYHIIKLEDREADRALTAEMTQAMKKRMFIDWLQKQRNQTAIERFVTL